MPQNPPNLKYVLINDFRPGIYSNLREPTVVSGIVLTTQQPGIAAEGTTGCVATPTGGLSPLPAQRFPGVTGSRSGTPDVNWTFQGQTGASNTLTPSRYYRPVAFGIAGPLYIAGHGSLNISQSFGLDEMLIAVESNHGTPPNTINRMIYGIVSPVYFQQGGNCFYQSFTGTTGKGGTAAPDLASVVGLSWGMTFEYVRANNSGFTTPGRPTWFSEWAEVGIDGSSGATSFGHGQSFVYPDPTAPTNTSPKVTDLGANVAIHYFNHNARIAAFNDFGYNHGPISAFNNETVTYADPPSNWQINASNLVTLDAQSVNGGYTAWGSISFGELLLVKRGGGAIIVSGDLYAPQITRLPGVMSTGNLFPGRAAKSPAGLIYTVANDGAYNWNGGNTSQKISNISDNFHVRANGNCAYGIQEQSAVWGPYVAFANGWLFDTSTGGWWNFNNATGLNAVGMVATSVSNPQVLFTLNDAYFGVQSFMANAYDIGGVLNTSYTWIGQPVFISFVNQIDIREVSVTIASPVATSTTITLSMMGIDGTFHPVASETVTLQSSQPQTFRFPCGVRSFGIAPKITITSSNNSDNAANLFSINVGYEEAAKVGQLS